MKVVAAINRKGGVGKTTTALSLCHAATKHGVRTLLIDFDNQANATASLVPIDDSLSRDNSYDLVKEERDIVPMQIEPNFALVPAANDLTQLDNEDFAIFFRLRERLRSLFASKFDLVVIDTPGVLGTRVTATLVACDAFYIPIELTNYALQSAKDVMELYQKVRSYMNPTIDFLGFLPNRVSKTTVNGNVPIDRTEREVYDALKQTFGADCLLGMIAQRRGIKDTMSTGGTIQDIGESDQSDRRAQDELTNFAHATLRRIGLYKDAAA
jgi:chromosome partitioning protein